MKRIALFVLYLLVGPSAVEADDGPKPAEPPSIKLRVTGLFAPGRVDDLREAIAELPEITLLDVDFETSEATFRFDPAKAFPGTKPGQIAEAFDGRLRSVSRHTLGIRERSRVPQESLQYVEVPVAGLDCKGCALGAYEAISRVAGVEQATADFKAGLVTARIDPAKVDRAGLEAALRSRGVVLRKP